VADVLRDLAGRPTSDVELGVVGLSNEIVDHVLELKTTRPLTRLVDSELVLAELVRRVALVLAERGARLLPTAMHPWLDPTRTRLWSRSGRRVYATYERLFDVRTHGWANVQAMHVNLPVGSDDEAVAMMNAARLLVPYLPAVAASSPMYDGRLQPAVDNRLAWIVEHQARIPESCGDIVPEPIGSLLDYRNDVLAPMYAAVDRLPDAGVLRREYFNARGSVFKFSRDSMEVRVIDTQECVHLDHAIAALVRHGLRWLASRPAVTVPQEVLVRDFRAVVARGSLAEVEAPHLLSGGGSVRDALQVVLDGAASMAPPDERPYLDRVAQILREGSLSERIAAALRPHADDPQALGRATRRVYDELAACLAENRPWSGRAVWSP
jgi:gamma-glutamyl:cysteine ligase YbdK (ATP-grasp superfamily)